LQKEASFIYGDLLILVLFEISGRIARWSQHGATAGYGKDKLVNQH
jgi:hypothetical protein